MCLRLTEDSARLKKNLRRRKKSITAYKCVFDFEDKGIWSEYKEYQWNEGLNTSDRKACDLTNTEVRDKTVDKGFHFFLNLEDAESYRQCRCQCQYRSRCPYRYRSRYRHRCPYFKVIELKVDPKDIVAVGIFNNKDCLVATKATLKEIVK